MLNIINFLDDPVINPSNFCQESGQVWRLIGVVINIFKIAIPVIIVLLAMLDLGKAVMAGEEKEIKEAQKMLIKRLIYGVLIFFVVTIVQVIFNLIGTNLNEPGSDGVICWACATRPNSDECKNNIK